MFADDTLDDIKARDIDNLETILRRAHRYVFTKAQDCATFYAKAMDATLRRCGVTLNHGMDAEAIDGELDRNKVKIERRKYDEDSDKHRQGVYVYKNNEIAAWISEPEALSVGGFIVRANIQC